MNRKILALTAVGFLFVSNSAFALETGTDTKPEAATGDTHVAPADPAPKPDCKPVTINRADVTASPIVLSFKSSIAPNDLVSLVNQCNDGVKDTTFAKAFINAKGGVDIVFGATTGAVGSGKVSLPISMTDGTADKVICLRGGGHQKYATAWKGSLPSTLDAAKLDTYDRAAADRACPKAQDAGTM